MLVATMKHYEFLDRVEYFEQLTVLVRQSRRDERVIVASMSFVPDSPEITQLVIALAAAARRGANVTFIVDAIALLTVDHGWPIPSLSLNRVKMGKKPITVCHDALQTMQAAGVDCQVINMPTRRVGLIQQGRSHIKGAVIGDEVFVGGCNLDKPDQIDVMVHWHDASIADRLADWLMRITSSSQTREAFNDVDVEALLDPETSLLLDAGVPRQSIIYDEALTLIDRAEKWLYLTCQYFPGGETAKHLAAAEARGVELTIIFSHPRAHGRSAVLHHAHQLMQRGRRLPSTLFVGRLDKQLPKLHAKVLISERAALVGSHNYVVQGVNFGTAELALKSTNPEFGIKLRHFMEQQLHALTQ